MRHDPVARQALDELHAELLLGTGDVVRTSRDGGLTVAWSLTWREQREAGVRPVIAQSGRELS
ncbi:hypothetical protein [Nonomuraea sediminis]|uniref:hypothetical protein n=1 Tax=Nonomuraea sediminis TaxID=2835864 RepID=UPI001BDC26B0|nr:hypothetical protein [Nonomuraea sediminis]